MQIINYKAFVEDIEYRIKHNGCSKEYAQCAADVLEVAKLFIREFESPHGEWKETGYETGALGITYQQTQCSNCGWEHALPMWWNYCPNCGADMRGDT